jgi:hypothetical protein
MRPKTSLQNVREMSAAQRLDGQREDRSAAFGDDVHLVQTVAEPIIKLRQQVPVTVENRDDGAWLAEVLNDLKVDEVARLHVVEALRRVAGA